MTIETVLDAINKAHETRDRLAAIGDLLSEASDDVSHESIRSIGFLLMDYADTFKECADKLWEGQKRGAA